MVIENFKIHENAIEGFGEWNGTENESFTWNSKWFSEWELHSLMRTEWNGEWVKRRLKLRKASSGDWNDDWFELITEWNADWNWETIRNDVIVSWKWRDDTNWEWRDGAIEWRLRMEEWREDAIEWRSAGQGWSFVSVCLWFRVRTLNKLQNIKWEIF
jgi:hypothetical protein